MAKVQPNAAAKPQGADKKKDKKPKVELPKFPQVGNKDPNVYPFKTIPTDYSFDKHAALDKDDFVDRKEYLEYRARGYEHKAAQLREQAKTGKTGGGGKVKRLAKMLDKAEAIKAELAAAGIDVEALLRATKAQAAAPVTAPAAAPAGNGAAATK